MRRRVRLFYVLVAAFVIAACGMMTINRLDNDITILEEEYTDLHLEQVGVEAQQSKLKEELLWKSSSAANPGILQTFFWD